MPEWILIVDHTRVEGVFIFLGELEGKLDSNRWMGSSASVWLDSSPMSRAMIVLSAGSPPSEDLSVKFLLLGIQTRRRSI